MRSAGGAAAAVFAAALAAGAAAAEPYQIMVDSPVHATGAGNEAALVYGEAPGARFVDVTVAGQTHTGAVRDGAFRVAVPAPAPGVYAVAGSWRSGSAEGGASGPMEGGLLVVLGPGYGGRPDAAVTVSPGAGDARCADCIAHDGGTVGAGGHALVSNADSAVHRFEAAPRARGPVIDLNPGESVRLPFWGAGASYACVHHPWLEFRVGRTGADGPGPGGLLLRVVGSAGDRIPVHVSHAGGADAAHLVFVRDGAALWSGTAPLVDGRGSFVADAGGWGPGAVVAVATAGPDHAVASIRVGPPAGAADRGGSPPYPSPGAAPAANAAGRPNGAPETAPGADSGAGAGRGGSGAPARGAEPIANSEPDEAAAPARGADPDTDTVRDEAGAPAHGPERDAGGARAEARAPPRGAEPIAGAERDGGAPRGADPDTGAEPDGGAPPAAPGGPAEWAAGALLDLVRTVGGWIADLLPPRGE